MAGRNQQHYLDLSPSSCSQKGRLNVPLMYLHRIVRLTPVLAVAVLLFMTLFPRLDSGPLWQQFSSSYQLCSDTWWATLLYVQNYAAAGRMVS